MSWSTATRFTIDPHEDDVTVEVDEDPITAEPDAD